MKTSGKILIVVLCLIIIGLAAFIVYNKIYSKPENISNSEVSLSEQATTATKTNSNESVTENKTAISFEEKFSEKDLVVDGFSLGESAKAVESKYDELAVTEKYSEEATGRDIVRIDYKTLGLTVENSVSDDNPDGSMIRITLYGNSKLETARGIKIGDTKESVIKAYPADSILDEGENGITVGFTGDEPVYESSKGKIFFEIKDGKVDRILYAYGFAE